MKIYATDLSFSHKRILHSIRKVVFSLVIVLHEKIAFSGIKEALLVG